MYHCVPATGISKFKRWYRLKQINKLIIVPDGLSSKDELFNDVIMWMEKRNLLFLNADVEGKHFAQVKMHV